MSQFFDEDTVTEVVFFSKCH